MALFHIDDVRTRVEAEVTELAGKLGNAVGFADLVEHGSVPPVTPYCFILPGGLRGGTADTATGVFRQPFQETVSVVLMERVAADPLSVKGMGKLTPLAEDIIQCVAGWAPDNAIGVFELVQAELVGATRGVLVFQIDFALNDQLRIAA